jgi:hypothetical protein
VIIELRYARGDATAPGPARVGRVLAIPAVKTIKSSCCRRGIRRPGPRVVAATERLAKTLHPELFK